MRTILFTWMIMTLGLTGAFAQTEGIQFFEGSFAEALLTAKSNNKLLFVDCYAVWCGPCKWMEKNVFPTAEAGKFFNEHFVCYQLDMEKGIGPDVAKRFGVTAYPTYLFIDGNGKVVHRATSSMPAEDFIALGKTAIDPQHRLATLTERYDAGDRTADFIVDYARALQSANKDADASKVVSEYLATVPEKNLVDAKNWELISTYVSDVKSSEFQFVDAHYAEFEKRYGADVKQYINKAISQSTLDAGRGKDLATFKTILGLIDRYSDDPGKDKASAELNYYRRAGDWKNYSLAAGNYMENGYYKMNISREEIDKRSETTGKDYAVVVKQREAAAINGVVWTIYEHVTDAAVLKQAVEWIKVGVNLYADYAIMDTYAAILLKSGDMINGKVVALQAIQMAKQSGDDYSSTEELLKKYGL